MHNDDIRGGCWVIGCDVSACILNWVHAPTPFRKAVSCFLMTWLRRGPGHRGANALTCLNDICHLSHGKGQHLRWPISVLRNGEYGILSAKLRPPRRWSSQTVCLGYKDLIFIQESCHDILHHAIIDINAKYFYDIKMSCHNSFPDKILAISVPICAVLVCLIILFVLLHIRITFRREGKIYQIFVEFIKQCMTQTTTICAYIYMSYTSEPRANRYIYTNIKYESHILPMFVTIYRMYHSLEWHIWRWSDIYHIYSSSRDLIVTKKCLR